MKKVLAYIISLMIAYTPMMVFASYSSKDPYGPYGYFSPERVQARAEYAEAMRKRHAQLDKSIKTSGNAVNKSVIAQINASATVSDGSKVNGKATVTKPVNPSKVGQVLTKRLEQAKSLGKASLPTFVGLAAFHSLMGAIDWVMDEGGQVTKKPTITDPMHPTQQYYLKVEYRQSQAHLADQIISINDNSMCSSLSGTIQNQPYSGSTFEKDPSNGRYYCRVTVNGTKYTVLSFQTITNPNYNPSSPEPERAPVSDQEVAQKIADYVNNNADETTKKLIEDAYTGDSNSPSDSPQNELANEVKGDITTGFDSASTAPQPKPGTDNTAHSSTTKPDGTVIDAEITPSPTGGTSTGESTTTPNPDGSTTTQTRTDFQIPAFCDWASVVCEWLEWTQQEPDESSDNDVEVQEKEFDTSIFSKDRFSVSRQCPIPEVHSLNITGIQVEFSFDLTPICQVFEYARPALIACSYLYAAYIVIGAARNG